MKRLAVIDLGTNTFNLLIIDWEDGLHKVVYNTKVGVGLGLGGINKNHITPEAMERGLDTLRNYVLKCQSLKVDDIVAFGTSAIRNADNRQDFLDLVEQHLEMHIQVISGNREAELIYKGVTLGIEIQEPFLIMDIGGGSTEFILGDSNFLIEAASFEIGAARIFQSREFSDPFTAADCKFIEDYLDKGVGSFFNQIKVNQLIGASGSFETFYELLSNHTYPKEKYVVLDKDALLEQVDKVIFSTKKERELDDRIIPIRKKMAPIAAVKIRWIIRKLNIQKIMISPYSLKEGVISEVISLK